VPTVRRDRQSLHRDTTTDDDDTSNLLSEQGLGIVLQEEFGDSAQHHTLFSSSYSTNSTAELLRPVPPVHTHHLTPPPSLSVMSLTPSTIDQSETTPPTGEGVGTENSSSTWRSSKGQLTTPSTPPPETRLFNSPLHHSTPRPHPSRSRIPPPPPPPSVTSFPLEKPTSVQHPSSLPPLPLSSSASPSETLTSSCTEAGTDTEEDGEEEEGGATVLTNTLREQEEVENPDSILEPDPGNGTAEENHTPVSSTSELTPSPSGGRKIGPPTPGEKERREILSSLYQRYQESAGPSQSRCRQKTGVYRHPGRKHGVKPGGQRSGRLASSRAKDDSREDKKKQKLGVTSDLFPVVEASLPVCPVSMETVRDLWRKQLRQITTLTKPTPSHPHRVDQQIEAMGRKHSALLESLKKEIDHTRRLRGQEETRAQQRAVRAKLEAKRQATARARRYFRDYELELKAKLQKKRTNEELVFRRAFEDGLVLLKEREREVRKMAKEKKEQQTERLRRDLEAMEQYYSDQFSMLAESLARERENAAARDEARAKVSRHSPPPTPPPVCVCVCLQLSGQLGRETRQRLEREVTDLQTCLDRDDDVTHFRELDAQQLRLALHHLLTPL
jgi:hypothetical protein